MDALKALRGFRANPSDITGPWLRVSRGPLTPEDETIVTASAYKGYPYAMLLGLPDETMERDRINGPRPVLARVDLILEARKIPGSTAPLSWEPISELYAQIMLELPPLVDEVAPGLPIVSGVLEYAGGLGRPEIKPSDTSRLIAGLSYTALFKSPY